MADEDSTETPTLGSKPAIPKNPKRSPPKLGKMEFIKKHQRPPTSENTSDDEAKRQEIDKGIHRGQEGDSDFYQNQDQGQAQNQQEEEQQEEEQQEEEQQEEGKAESEPQPNLEEQRFKYRRRRARPARPYRQESDVESINVSQSGNQPQPQKLQGTRQLRRHQPYQQLQERETGSGNALQHIGGVEQAGQLVQNTAVDAVHGATDSAGKAVSGVLNQTEAEKDSRRNEQLRLRLDLNLDIEIELKAKIRGDLTLGLLN